MLESRTLLSGAGPAVISIERSPPDAITMNSTKFTVTFSENVTGVDSSDFAIVKTGTVVNDQKVKITQVSGAVYTASVTGIYGAGTLGINLVDDGSIRDSANLPLATHVSFSPKTGSVIVSAPTAVADFNEDGKPDLAVAGGNASTVGVYLGHGDGTFKAGTAYPVAHQATDVIAADLNEDGHLDLVATCLGSNVICVLLGRGDGTFNSSVRVIAGSGTGPESLAAGDVDNDGHLDIVTSNVTGSVSVLIGNGNGTFETAQVYNVGSGKNNTSQTQFITLADLNGDGNLDLARSIMTDVGFNYPGAIGVLLGNGTGVFQQQTNYTAGYNPHSLQVADLNGDHVPDLVATNGGDTDNYSVLLGTGAGTFQPAQVFAAGTDVSALAVADVDGDGIPDLAVVDPAINAVGVFRGNGDGTFQPQHYYYSVLATSSFTSFVSTADLNGDGRIDLVVSSNGPSSVLLSHLVTDFNGTMYSVDVDFPPTDIALDHATVGENKPLGTLVGAFSATDKDPNETFTYSLVSGSGSTGNASFSISGNQLLTAQVFDASVQNSYSIRVRVTDSRGLSYEKVFAIGVTVGNQPPVIGGFSGTIDYPEHSIPILIASDATVKDYDSSDFDTGSLTLTITQNVQSYDYLSIRSQGNGPGQIAVANGNKVYYGGIFFGTSTGGTNKVGLTITFNANATPTAAQALLRTITFESLSPTPSTLPRTVRAIVRDGDGGTSASVYKTINVIVTNNNPGLGFQTTNATYTGVPVVISPQGEILDQDSPNFDGGVLTLNLTTNAQGSDVLAVRNQGTGPGQVGVSGVNVTYGGIVVGTFTGGTNKVGLKITFNANSSPVIAREVLRNITFSNSSATPPTARRTLVGKITDGDGGTSVSQSMTVTFQLVMAATLASNQSPVISQFAGSINYAPGESPVLIDYDAIVTDADSSTLNGGAMTISLTANGQGSDVLAIRNQGRLAGKIGVSGSSVLYGGVAIGTLTGGTNKVGLKITFNADSTPEAAQALLRNITFVSTLAAPSTAPRTVRVILTDGSGGTSAAMTKTITVASAHASPVIAGFDGSVNYTPGAGATIIDSDVTVTDQDSPNLNQGQLTVSLRNNIQGTDILSVRNIGTGAGQIGVSGSNVTYGGVIIGTLAGGAKKVPMTVIFNANAAAAAAQALLRAVTFQSTLSNPVTLTRTVRVILTDGHGGTSNEALKSITIG
ncbi:beta strand repeat-containing protein [Planctomicrobium piriforme]|uniref:beta strand repeat-containing protein n=1 Tax=Planctomicrobium piriforme TaxID=1576369 RepID=UPI0015877A8F|nr:FG-GAP-like repeat-containing protein [Planctomicrobium piriforme]